MSRRRRRVRGARAPRALTVVLDELRYIAPRVGTVPANGRVVRRSLCGHDVYLGARGVDAVTRRGKRLYCFECQAAIGREHGMTLGVWFPEDGAA